VLVLCRGPEAGTEFELDTDVVGCGRDPGNEIVLDDVTVSRKHTEFHRGAGEYTVCDMGSLNGTYVNGERVRTATLTTGDEVRIGRYVLLYRHP
jgi:pSer/pThr/pTyr-binding forkhead associated (FHA) protein